MIPGVELAWSPTHGMFRSIGELPTLWDHVLDDEGSPLEIGPTPLGTHELPGDTRPVLLP